MMTSSYLELDLVLVQARGVPAHRDRPVVARALLYLGKQR
jgi:hypothetical protein